MIHAAGISPIDLKPEICTRTVHLNLAYRWFCRLGLEGDVPDHSTFSKNRHSRFRDSDVLRPLFEATVKRCERKKVEMLFAHLKLILRLDRLRLRGPIGAR